MAYMMKFESLVSSDSIGGYYNLANFVKTSPASGYIQSCTSRECCTGFVTRKWTNKKSGITHTKRYPSYDVKDKDIKLRTTKRSELRDDCSDCGSSLFTEKTN